MESRISKASEKNGVNHELKIVQTETGEVVTIPQKDVDKGPKRLGVRISADGSWKKEKARWIAMTVNLAKK